MTALDWVINVAGVPAERVLVFGQSLGTAVASGVAEICASDGIELAGFVLVAGFSNLPAMLTGYRVSGVVPVLGPLQWTPFTSRLLETIIYEKWLSTERWTRVVKKTGSRLRLSLVHAMDDMDIPCIESDKLFEAAAVATLEGGSSAADFEARKKSSTVEKGDGAFVATWNAPPNIIIRQELSPYGGEWTTSTSNSSPYAKRRLEDVLWYTKILLTNSSQGTIKSWHVLPHY